MPGKVAQAPVDHENHVVEFYAADDELAASVRRFLGEGLLAGEAALVVATPSHRAAVKKALAADAALPSGRVLMVDAARTLQGFLDGHQLDADRFQVMVADLIGWAAGSPPRPVRIYAEMVSVLWDAGKVTLALELQALWNDLATRMPFTLLSAYPTMLMTEHGDPRTGADACDPQGESPVTAPTGYGSAERWFPAHLDSARQARRFVLGLLDSRLEPSVAVDASIIIAELAANAVLHARSPFRVTVSESGGFVRINVADAVPLPAGGLVTVPGHGLDVVSKAAARWAAEPRPDGKAVWAELPAGPRRRAGAAG